MTKRAVIAIAVASSVLIGAGLFAPRIELGRQANGSYLVSTGQTLTPAGKLVLMPFARPKELKISPDGRSIAVLATNGVHIYDTEGKEISKVSFSGGPCGLAWSEDGNSLFASQENGSVAMLRHNGSDWTKEDLKIDLPDKKGNPQATGLAVDGGFLYVALGTRNVVAKFELASRTVALTIPTDVAPYLMAIDRREHALYVSCKGGPIAGPEGALSAGTRVTVDPNTDTAATGTVDFIDLATNQTRPLLRGRDPAGVATNQKGFLVAMAGEDTIRSGPKSRSVRPADDANFGQIPTAVTFSPDGNLAYVALGGANAIAVCDAKTLEVNGYIPTAWYPIDLAFVGDRLVVACAKGIGSRVESEAGAATSKGIQPGKGQYYIHNNVGALEFIEPAQYKVLAGGTALVRKNNSWGKELPARPDAKPVPIPERVGEPSVFKHVVYIIKENLTYDSVLGDMREGEGREALCMFPEFVTPNHHQLARDFVLLDNTYVSGTNSADGHQWTDSAVANDYMERNYSAYARSYPYDGGDPLAFSPEGFIWNAAITSHKSVRVFGEFVDKPVVRNKETGKGGTAREIWRDYKSGAGKFDIHAETSQKALEKVLNPYYIGFPNTVSDQWRVDRFMDEFHDWEKAGTMPNLTVMLLPDDHTGGFQRDFPTPWAAVADNDLALGRVVEAISKSQFWKDTMIVCIEDDGQTGLDHIDGHRTFAMCASPYTRRGAVVSEPYTTLSVVRTIGLVLGMPAMTRFDRTARPMRECFLDRPDFTPYKARPNRVPLDQFTPAPEKLTGEAKELALESAKQDWSDLDRADAAVIARSAWLFSHPNERFPAEHFHPEK